MARGFLTNTPILIRGEPNSSVDIKTEADIIGAMGRLMQNRTTFMYDYKSIEHAGDLRLLLLIKDGELVRVSSDVSTIIEDTSTFAELDTILHRRRVSG
jgi:ABC-type multidrug transport system fused ATPase/permease subunit